MGKHSGGKPARLVATTLALAAFVPLLLGSIVTVPGARTGALLPDVALVVVGLTLLLTVAMPMVVLLALLSERPAGWRRARF